MLSSWVLGLKPILTIEQQVLLTAEPPLQPESSARHPQPYGSQVFSFPVASTGTGPRCSRMPFEHSTALGELAFSKLFILKRKESVCVRAHMIAHTRSSEDNSWRRVLSCYLVGSKDWIQVTQPAPVCAGLLPAEPPWERASECTPHRNNKLIVLSNYFGTINLTTNCVRKEKVGWQCPNSKPPAGRDPLSSVHPGPGMLSAEWKWLLARTAICD